jgi:probable rRNA maturation factor
MTGAPKVEVTISCAGWRDHLPDSAECATAAAAAAWRIAGRTLQPGGKAEISLLLTDDATVRTLNRRHRAQDKPTNVLSFPLDDDPAPASASWLLGDVVLACETVADEARAQGKPVADHFRHLVVHGILHLLGYDHVTDGDAAIMEQLEVAALASLGVADPYQNLESSQSMPRQCAR